MRTTVDIQDPLLRDLKRLQKERGTSLAQVINDLLMRALALETAEHPVDPPAFRWRTKAMGQARVDLLDKDALHAILDVRR